MSFRFAGAVLVFALLVPAQAQQPQPDNKDAPKTQDITVGPPPVPGVAPEYQDAARKSLKARQKVAYCQKVATDQKVLPRDRTQFVLACIDKLQD